MKILPLIIITLITGISNLHAEEAKRTVGHYIGFGGVLFNTDKMKNELSAAGYNASRDWAYMISFGLYARKRFVLEGEVNGLIWKPVDRDLNETKLYGITSSINLGVNVLPLDKSMALYPYIGSGFGKSYLFLNQTSAQFSDAVATPPTSFQMKQGSYSFLAGIGYDFTFKGRGKKGRTGIIGFRTGYMFDVTDNDDWISDDVEIHNGPELRNTGFYGKIILGKTFNNKRYKCKHKN
jgi:hypothetical protein